MVEAEETSEALSASDRAVSIRMGPLCFDKLVVQPLVVAFLVVMGDVVFDGPAKRFFTQENHPIQTFGFD